MTEKDTIRCRPFKDVDISGCTVVEAVPVMGLPAAIAGSYIVRTLDLDHVCGFASDAFPPVTTVWNGKPRFPVRAYAREGVPLAVVVSEFTPQPPMYRPLARAILDWARDAGAARVMSPDGFPASDPAYDPENPRVVGVATTDALRKRFEREEVPGLARGMLSGVSGVLLTEAMDREFEAGSLLVEVSPEDAGRIHDARATAVLVQTLQRLEPKADLAVDKLFEEAGRAEEQLRELRSHAARAAPGGDDVAAAYR